MATKAMEAVTRNERDQLLMNDRYMEIMHHLYNIKPRGREVLFLELIQRGGGNQAIRRALRRAIEHTKL